MLRAERGRGRLGPERHADPRPARRRRRAGRALAIERFYRDARLYRIYEGADEIQKLVIARQMLAAHRAKVPA